MNQYGQGYNHRPDTSEFPPQPGPVHHPYIDHDPTGEYRDQDFAGGYQQPQTFTTTPPRRLETPVSQQKARQLKKVGRWMMILSFLALVTNIPGWFLIITFVAGIAFYVHGRNTHKRWERQERIRGARIMSGVPPEQFY